MKRNSGFKRKRTFVKKEHDEERHKQSEISTLDLWSTRAASWSQIGILIVIAVGYIFTVRPVFQYQLIQEEAAKLEIDNLKSKEELASSLEQIRKTENNIKTLKQEFEANITINQELTNSLNLAKKKESEARQNIKDIESQIKGKLQKLEKAQWEILLLDFVFVDIAHEFNRREHDFNNPNPDEDIIQKSIDNWPQPYKKLIAKANKLIEINKKNNEFPPEYIQELKNYIISKKSSLMCETVNFDKIKSDYNKEQVQLKELIESELNVYIEKVKEDSGLFTIITDEFRNKNRKIIRIGKEYSLESKYRKLLFELEQKCSNKETVVMNEFHKLKGAKR